MMSPMTYQYSNVTNAAFSHLHLLTFHLRKILVGHLCTNPCQFGRKETALHVMFPYEINKGEDGFTRVAEFLIL